jgi:RHS repeat-associated protein
VTSYTYNPRAGKPGGCGPAVTDLCEAVQARDGITLARVAYSYDSLDRVHTITRGNGVTTTIGYTDASQVKTETTTAADGSVLRTDGYTYDSHGNVATHTITSVLPAPAAPGRNAPRARAAGPATTTTAYGYDAYNRLISSAVYPRATATGTPVTTTTYTVDAAGNVTGQDTTTSAGTTHTVNTITPGGELTARTTDGTRTGQKFDTDGNVTTDLAGDTYTYDPDGQQATVTTPAGITTTYAYWPDGTRRSATTTADGVTHTITYHYATTGPIVNDTYSGGGPAVTASYLMAVSREARTLTAATGTGPGTVQATGAGTGYYLTDAHGSVTAMIGNAGQVTAAYAYGDYGQPEGASPALLPAPAPSPAGNAAVNPFGYDGAYTNPSTGTQYLPARSYDPAQGRFLSPDAADQFNRYQAFDTNPIVNTDPTGQFAIPQWVTDFLGVALFIAIGGISAVAAAPVFEAVVAGAEIATGAIVSASLNAVTAVANIGAAATSLTLGADDAAAVSGNGFLSAGTKEKIGDASFILGNIAGFTGVAAGFTALAQGGAAEAVGSAEKNLFTAEAESEEVFTPDEQNVIESQEGTQSQLADTAWEESVSPAGGESPQGISEQQPISQVTGSGLPAGESTAEVVPPPPDAAAGTLSAGTQQLGGDDANLNPTGQPFEQPDELPGSQTSVAAESATETTSEETTSTVLNPLADEVTATVENTESGNNPLGTPSQEVNPAGGNTPASVLEQNMLNTETGLNSGSPIAQGIPGVTPF